MNSFSFESQINKFNFVHASGILVDSIAANIHANLLRKVFTPKVEGYLALTKARIVLISMTYYAVRLQLACDTNKVSWFMQAPYIYSLPMQRCCCFSSLASLLSLTGSAVYGAANAALECCSKNNLNQGLPSTTIQWGPWSTIGMVSDSESVSAAMRKYGISMIDPFTGLSIFNYLLWMEARPLVSYIPTDFGSLGEEIRRLYGVSQTYPVGSFYKAPSSADKYPCARKEDYIMEKLKRMIEAKMQVSIINTEESIFNEGIDSLASIEIQSTIQNAFDCRLPATTLFDFPTIRSMADEIDRLTGIKKARVGKEQKIVELMPGQACCPSFVQDIVRRSPCGIDDDDMRLLTRAQDCTTVAPFERWDVDRMGQRYPDQLRFGKYLTDIDLFDAEIFKISNIEAITMDPQQRILLEVSL